MYICQMIIISYCGHFVMTLICCCHAHTHTRTYVRTYVRTHAHTHTCAHASRHTRAHASRHTRTQTQTLSSPEQHLALGLAEGKV